MATPKVFVSSTCYDLREIRDSLYSFAKSFGFDPVLSEFGDVFFHPDLHTHEACVNEVANCQLFILLIGGRFGGSYISDKSKSITNAEYEAALKCKIPVFTYIKRAVLENHHLYQSNKDKEFIKSMNFPAIEVQEHAVSIFEFINSVRRASVNNAYEPFETSKDIESHLRKQWSSMFYDFLKNRELSQKIAHTNLALDGLVGTADKLESLVKSLYKSVDKVNAESEIKSIETISLAKEFLSRYVDESVVGVVCASNEDELKELAGIDPSKYKWHEYVSKITHMELDPYFDDDSKNDNYHYSLPDEIFDEELDRSPGFVGFTASGDDVEEKPIYEQETNYLFLNGMCKLDESQRLSVLRDFSSLRIVF